MKSDQDKLANFERIVLNDATTLREDAIENLAKEKNDAVNQARAEITGACNRRFIRETDRITRKINEALIKNNTKYKETLLMRREELIGGLFNQVVARVNALVLTKEYESYMQILIDDAAKLISLDEASLKLCERDKGLNLKLDSFKIEYASDELLGGFIMIDYQNGLMIDETFALKLSKLKDEFLQLCHLQIA